MPTDAIPEPSNYSTNAHPESIVAKNPTTLFSFASLDALPADSTQHLIMDTRETQPMPSNAMPIPGSRMMSDFSAEMFDIDQSQSSEAILPDHDFSNYSLNNSNSQHSSSFGTPISGPPPATYGMQPSTSNSNAMWSAIGDVMGLPKQELYRMDDDDIFQVDKADLFQGPTLSELNDDTTILQDLNIEDYILQDEHSGIISGGHPNLMLLQANNSMSNSPSMQQMMQINNQPQIMHNQQQQQQQQHTLNQQHQQIQQNMNQLQDLPAFPNNDMIFEFPNNPSPMFAGYQTSTPTRSIMSRDTLSPQSQTSSTSSNLLNHSVSPPLLGFNNNPLTPQHKSQYSTLQELLKKEYSEYSMSPDRLTQLGQSVPGPSSTPMSMAAVHNQDQPYSHRRLQFTQQQASSSRLSSSAPTNSTSMWEAHQQQMWARREPRQHLLSTGSVAEAESFSSLSTAGILSPEAQDFSHDEGYDDSDDSDHYEDYSTDNDSDNEETPRGTGSKKERFFWQYNVQSKGPKGTRLVIQTQVEDPHVLNEVTDPVFSPNCSVRGIKVIKHSGKARKGDGNDLTPNPRKLFSIGKELDKLGRTINDMPPVSELPFNVRPKSRKEKNKLASRACRLKKKAQHEANKIKLYGLETEHKRLVNGILDIKKSLAVKCSNPNDNADETNAQIDSVAKSSTQLSIAGTSTEFVNKILEKVKSGVPMGGLEEI